MRRNILAGVLVAALLLMAGCDAQQPQMNQDAAVDDALGDNALPPDTRVVATVNGEEITADEVAGLQQAFAQQGQQLSEDRALEQLIDERVLIQESRRYLPTDEEAEQVLQAQLAQQGADLESFKQQLAAQGVTYEEQLESIKNQIAVREYLNTSIDEQAITVSDEEARAVYEEYRQQYPEVGSFEEVQPQIVASLEQQKQQEQITLLIDDLRQDADVEYR